MIRNSSCCSVSFVYQSFHFHSVFTSYSSYPISFFFFHISGLPVSEKSLMLMFLRSLKELTHPKKTHNIILEERNGVLVTHLTPEEVRLCKHVCALYTQAPKNSENRVCTYSSKNIVDICIKTASVYFGKHKFHWCQVWESVNRQSPAVVSVSVPGRGQRTLMQCGQ